MKNHLSDFCTEKTLLDVWKDSKYSKKSYRGLPGIDGETADKFRASLNYNIQKIIHQIRSCEYKFSELRLKVLDKPNGGKRILCIPTLRDRLVQRYVLYYFSKRKIKPIRSDITYGFVAGKDWSLKAAHKKAQELRQEHNWVFQTDIKKFFDTVQRSDVVQVIPKNIPKFLSSLIKESIHCELKSGQDDALVYASGLRKGIGLRQGMPLSPFLTNLLLKDFDNYFTKRKIPAVRYADDITVFADSKSECENYLRLISKMLADLGLEIQELTNEASCKTKILEPTQTLEFLGVEIKKVGGSYSLLPPFKAISSIDKALGEISNVEFCIKNEITFIEAIKKIDARIAGNITAFNYVDKHDEFESELKALSKKHQNKLLTSILGEKAVATLPNEKKRVLGMEI